MGCVWALETQGLGLKPDTRICQPDGLEQACLFACSFNKYLLNLGQAVFQGLGSKWRKFLHFSEGGGKNGEGQLKKKTV